jgi:hypothetical protein
MLPDYNHHYERTVDMAWLHALQERAVDVAYINPPPSAPMPGEGCCCMSSFTNKKELLIMPNCAHQEERAVDNTCLHTPQERAVDCA